MGQFLNNPPLRRSTIWERDHDPRRPWVLMADLLYHSHTINRTLVVRSGFRSDMATVPWFFRRIFPQDGPWSHAAIVHDYLCVCKIYDHRTAARVFREAMADLRVSRLKREIMYRAVLHFGPRW